MPNASTEVGGGTRGGTRLVEGGLGGGGRERAEGEGKGGNIKICFVFRSDGRIPTVPDCRAPLALGVVPNSFWDRPGTFCGEPRFCFLRCRRAIPSHRLPLRLSVYTYACGYTCVRTRVRTRREQDKSLAHIFLIPDDDGRNYGHVSGLMATLAR